MVTRKQAWAMWLIASIFYAYQYILRVMPSVMLEEITSKFNITLATFGQLSGSYYLGYSLIHLPLGWLLDHYGPKKIMPIFMGFTVLGMLPFIFSELWIYPIIGRILIGIGSSAAILGAFKIIRIGFREEQFAKMLSFSVMIGLIGAIYGGGPLNYLKQQLGFELVTYILIFIGTLLSIITYFIIPAHQENLSKSSFFSEIKEVFTNYKIVAICLLSGLMVGPLEGFADVWGTSFLKIVYGYNDNLAASLPSLIFIGMCFGSPILSIIASKTGKYFSTIIASAIIMGLSFLLILFGNISVILMSFTFIIIGFLSSYQIIAIYKASNYAKEELVGLTTASANMIIMIFGYIFHSQIGKIISMNSSGIDSKSSYINGISVIPAGLLIAAIGFIIIAFNENRQNKK